MDRINISVKDDTNFKTRCRYEQKAFDEWPKKWDWILSQNKERNEKLNAVMENISDDEKKAMMIKDDSMINNDPRSLPPYPLTTSGEIGWISNKQEFQLEIFGPYFTHIPIKMKPNCPN